jgi:para-nitrobenzyl esterase
MRNLQADVMVQTFPSLEVDNKKFDLELSGMRLPIAPIIDGHVIPNDPNLILAAGAQNPVPLIIGNTRDEMNLFMVMTRTPAKVEDYVKEIQDDFGHLTDAIVDAYPAKNSKEIRSAIVQLTGDVMFVSQARYTARQHSAVQPTFRYEFSLGSKQGFLRALGAHHASELAYLFQRPAEPDDNDRNVAKILGRYWINLAATGNPNGDGLPTWPAYNRDSEEMINFEKGVEVLKGHRNRQLDAIDIYLRDVNAKESAAK